MLDFDYMAPEVISNAVRLTKNPEEHVICGIKYVPEKRCEGCAIPGRDYGHAPRPCMFCLRNNDRRDMYEPKVVDE